MGCKEIRLLRGLPVLVYSLREMFIVEGKGTTRLAKRPGAIHHPESEISQPVLFLEGRLNTCQRAEQPRYTAEGFLALRHNIRCYQAGFSRGSREYNNGGIPSNTAGPFVEAMLCLRHTLMDRPCQLLFKKSLLIRLHRTSFQGVLEDTGLRILQR